MKRARITLLLGAIFASACANVLGVTNYRNASFELCRDCDGLIPDCENRLNEALTSASDEEVSAWLTFHQKSQCETAACDEKTLECFYQAPDLCADTGETCAYSQACCGFDFKDARAGAGCCSKGGGSCCEQCLTCAKKFETIKLGEKSSTDNVCLSHIDTWEDLDNCAFKQFNTGCKAKCGTLGTGVGQALCVTCLQEACAKEMNACNQNTAP